MTGNSKYSQTKYQNRSHGNNNEKRSDIQYIIDEIKRAESLKSILKPEKYALPGGWAEKTAEVLAKGKGSRNEKLNNNQLRKIFTQIKTVEALIKSKSDEFDKFKEEIFLIMPLVAYAYGRDLIPKEFYDLMKECLNAIRIKSPEDYYEFVKFYTAIVAYFKVKVERKGK